MVKKILAVDDEEDIRTFIKTLLEEEGYKVSTAKDGIDCINQLKDAKFDLILIDFFMPGMSGRELAERIRKNKETKNLKFAFLTVAAFGEEGQKELKKLGSLDYIRKPIDNDDFKRRIKNII